MEEQERIKGEIKHKLLHLNIQHVTLETETESLACETKHEANLSVNP
jgi:hypothetical protein